MNKLDRVNQDQLQQLQARFSDAWFICAHAPSDVARVREGIIAIFDSQSIEEEILVPYSHGALVSELHAIGKVLSQDYGEDGVRIRLRGAASDIAKIKSRLPMP
jgi:GTP-binding protein HflX